MQPKVSIIVPVYNAEKYIRRALDSLKAQTMNDFEVVIIDDGSKDASRTICEEYAAEDSRFRVIHKPNAGVSAARQDGIENAIGEYTIHVDSDDWVEPTMLEELYNKAKSEDADMVICDYYTNTNNKQMLNSQFPTDVTDNNQTIRDLFLHLHGSCWNKLVRRTCFIKYNIRFPRDVNYCEDQLTIVRLLSHPIKVCYLKKPFYHYFDNPLSITRNYQRAQYQERLAFAELLKEALSEELKVDILPKVNYYIFAEAFIFDVLNDDEIKHGLCLHKMSIQASCIRWRIGFYFLSLGLKSIAHIFIKY